MKIKLFNRLKKNFWLILILFLALFLRIWRLGEVPPSLNWDEAALGYNAYSILKTGRDEYGKLLPLIFKSFGDYKPGLYVYLAVPFVAVLGLTELAVRLPSAILGGLSVGGVALLVSELSRMKISRINPNRVGLTTAVVLALNPWHINFSRGAWEANVALFLILLGVYFFLLWLKRKKNFYFFIFTFSLLLSLYTYQGAKLFVPLLILGLVVIFQQKLRRIPKKQVLLALLPFLLVTPLYLGALGKMGGRLRVMSVFSYPRPKNEIDKILIQDKTTQNSLLFRFFHSEALNFARGILGRYFNHFSGRFLFFEGDWQNPRLGVPYMGMLYFIDLVFVLLGLAALIRIKGRSKYLLLWWLLAAPIPAALSRDAVSSVRALPMVIPLVVLVSLGIGKLIFWLKDKPKGLLLVACCLLLVAYLWCFAYYLDQYYIHRAKKYSQTMQYGYKKVVNFVYSIYPRKYKRIIFTRKYRQPYIYWLFYTRYNPNRYQKQAHLAESPVGDVGQVEKIDNIEFRDIFWPADRGLKKSLFIGTEFELPEKDLDPKQAQVLKEIYFLNGQLAFRIVETL